MSRPKHYYYGNVKKLIMMSNELPENRIQTAFIKMAIKDATEETLKLPNGEDRMKAVNDVLIKKIRTIEGEALELHYSWRTVQNWINSFINMVGRNAGY